MSSHGRSNRSASIPIPRSIEAALPLSFGTSPGSLSRSRPTSTLGGVGIRGHVTLAGTSSSSSRHTPSRSFTAPHPPFTSSVSPVEPRRIRPGGGVGPSRSVEDSSPVPLSPVSQRRRSFASSISTSRVPARPGSYRAPSGSTASIPATSSPSVVVFAPPPYLAHSSLHHLLQTEAPPSLPPSRYAIPETSTGMPSVVWPHTKLRDRTPVTDSEDESTPPRELGIPPSVLISSSPTLKLPTRWSDQDRNPALSVSSDGRDLTYNGAAIGDKEAAAARTNHPIPPACGIYYYEVMIIAKGTRGGISVGLASDQVRLSRIPGWEPHSWGYRGEDGLVFASDKTGTPYGPRFEDHDTIGCGMDFTQNKAFFTRNGRFLGNVFEGVGKNCDIYPCVSLRQQTETIRVNFGHEDFVFKIDEYVQQQRNLVWAGIQNTPIAHGLLGRFDTSERVPMPLLGYEEEFKETDVEENERLRAPLGKLVLEYLEHHGYAKTAREFKTQFEHQDNADLLEGSKTPVPVPVPAAFQTADEDMDMDDLTSGHASSSKLFSAASSSSSMPSSSKYMDDLEARLCIVNAVTAGDMDTAIDKTAHQFPKVLAEDEGLMLVKLKCRKFVELVLQASEAMKRMKEEQREREESREHEDDVYGVNAMDIDDSDALPMPAPGANGFSSQGISETGATNGSTVSGYSATTPRGQPPMSHATSEYQSALMSALSYGQKLRSDYKLDARSGVQSLFKRTFGIVAYDDPASAGPEVAEVVGPEAKAALANELNIAILKSQGRPSHPALEQLYRQAAACIEQLGLIGVGSAAYAELPKGSPGD
ncbi:SPRY-domain-containing protein [Heliocybe sulcata]|uniref:SPRY-domain-containing protein n=1 Tax=Heliocybe sulcata TaxID=5364 RepID=A0A5C3NIX1_9AGAM|nr:SPRY-domain-containing protein [Heliocybe sulcata]